MSGPIDERSANWVNEATMGIEVVQGRSTEVSGFAVTRVLPTKGRRTIGGWCFVDLMIPPDADDPHPLEVGPHPHIGLSTVTWLFEGRALHSDSLGTQQTIRPGQLNLMTSGHGFAHSELSTKDGVHGVQMWIALPERTRHGPADFEHHEDLPRVELANVEATVIVGSYQDQLSPARTDTRLIGMELVHRGGDTELAVDPGFEHAVVPIDAPVKVDDDIVEPGWLGVVHPGPDVLRLECQGPTRLMFLGGEPLGERIEMWWNFVARSKEELTAAWRSWQSRDTDRFAPVPTSLPRIDAPAPPWVPLRD
jgi:redox-sensitive bicupin YhaK (pirin superfamily)